MGTLLLVAACLMSPKHFVADETAAPRVQGKWMIVYAEEGGRRNNSWEQRQATVRDNTLTYEADGKEHSVQLKFGKHQTLEAEAGGKSLQGVYIAARDYFTFSLENGTLGASGGDAEAKEGHGNSSGSFILILRRARVAPGNGKVIPVNR